MRRLGFALGNIVWDNSCSRAFDIGDDYSNYEGYFQSPNKLIISKGCKNLPVKYYVFYIQLPFRIDLNFSI